MTHIRIGESVFALPDEQWEEWVRGGRIPANAWIRSPIWTKGVWRLANTLEVYHLFLPAERERPELRPPGLSDTIFARRGLSTTEILLVVNLAAAGLLLLIWRDSYEMRLFGLARDLREYVGSGAGFLAALIPMFLHVSPSHLFFNMIALLASGSMTEYFYGRWKMLGVYLLSGFGGAALSLLLRPKPTLSIGASGAIFGLYGLALLFLLRHRQLFSRRHRWKTIRIYIPIMVLAVVPAIFGGDFYGHLGGFLTGCVIGLFLPAGPRLVYLTEDREEERRRQGASVDTAPGTEAQ